MDEGEHAKARQPPLYPIRTIDLRCARASARTQAAAVRNDERACTRGGCEQGTLYAHFSNVGEVYERTVERFYGQTQTIDEHFACASCRNGSPVRPFCERLREAGPYASLVADERFLPTTMRIIDPRGLETVRTSLQVAGVPEQLAQAIYRFQMSGCYSVATSTVADDDEWRQYQEALDRFIQGGLSALGVEL